MIQKLRYLSFTFVLLCALCVNSYAQVTVKIESKPLLISQFQHGITHTQHSLDAWGNKDAIAHGKVLLERTTPFQNQHIMGWGANNPEPSPGVYDWSSLDARINIIREMKAIPVITLCAAPDWMKGGEAGKTDWKKIEVAPLPQHYDDFAKLAATVARRYPDVKYFQVWNEFKGLWNAPENNWDYRAYTTLYNKVYDALKAVNKNIKIGGPYLVIEGTGSEKTPGDAAAKPLTPRNAKVIDYWLQNKRGADFITIDRGVLSFHDKSQYSLDELMQLTRTFGDIAKQIKARTDLPLWWAEYYGSMTWNALPAEQRRQVAAAHYALIWKHMIENGTSVALYWGPQSEGSGLSGGGLFSDTRQENGGQPYPLFTVYEWIHQHFSKGTPIHAVTTSSPQVQALASDKKLLLINTQNSATKVLWNNQNIELAPFEVKLASANV